MQLSLKNIVTPTSLVAILLLLACTGLWFLPFISGSEMATAIPASHFSTLTSIFHQWTTPFVANIICLLITVLNGFLLSLLNNRFSIIREKTFLLFFVFFFLTSVWHEAHFYFEAHLALTFVILSFFLLLSSYRQHDCSEQAFLCGLLLACASLLVREFIFLFVPLWVGFAIMRIFSLRVFLATILGLIVLWLLFFATMFFIVPDYNFAVFFTFFSSMTNGWTTLMQRSSLFELIYFALLVALWSCAVVGIYSSSLQNAIRTRANINVVLLFCCFAILVALFFVGVFWLIAPLLAMSYAILFAQPVTLRQGNFYPILFIVFCVVNVVFAVVNL